MQPRRLIDSRPSFAKCAPAASFSLLVLLVVPVTAVLAACGDDGHAGSSGQASGGSGAGGHADSTASAGTQTQAGSSNGGTTSRGGEGGSGTGGMAGAGGEGGSGTGGMAGAGGETSGDAPLPPLRLDDTCGVLLGGNVCLHLGKQSDDGTSFTKSVTSTLGGSPGTMYQVKIHVRGVVEPVHVMGGTRGTPPQFVTGGARYAPGGAEGSYQYWRITTSVPDASYFLNNFTEGLSHVVHVIDYNETIPIGGGATVTLEVYDDNAHAISNTVNNPPLSIEGIPGSMMSGQFVQIDQTL